MKRLRNKGQELKLLNIVTSRLTDLLVYQGENKKAAYPQPTLKSMPLKNFCYQKVENRAHQKTHALLKSIGISVLFFTCAGSKCYFYLLYTVRL
ncbi:MAG: hypothetical protein CMQ16_06370 [Gammaproteobacteria bacterium]|nr:hypothetical protein [Gammaproteobacteria bacterium]